MTTSHPARVRVPRWMGLSLIGLAGLLGFAAPARSQLCASTGLERLLPGRPRLFNSVTGDYQFVVPVPAGLLSLTVETIGAEGSTGNADLFLRFGSQPATISPTHVSAGATNRERIVVESPPRGCWFGVVRATSAFSNVLLRVRFEVTERTVFPFKPERGLADDRLGEYRFFLVNVPAGTDGLKVTTTGGTGDADLFVQVDETPTDEAFTAMSAKAGSNDEEVEIASPQGGPWKIALKSTTPYSDVTLVVELVDDDCVPGETGLCLLSRRFTITVDFVNQHAGGEAGQGIAVADTEQTGSFWFFDPDLSELTVKMLDARSGDGAGCFWFFWAALTDVEYTITVTDTATLAQETFTNQPGSPSSGFDTGLFCE